MEKNTILFKTFVGIDISKKTIDVCILDNESLNPLIFIKESNDELGIKKVLKALEIKKICLSTVLFCYENTGVYTMPLNYFLSKNALHYWVVPAIEIKRSKGISRGKSDKTDAKDIAFYAKTNLHKYNPISLPEKDIQELKILFTEREKLVECLKQMSTTIENEGFYNKDVLKSVLKINQTTIKNLKKSIEMIEKRMEEILSNNESLKEQVHLVTSIPGIGIQTALYLILATNSFKNFSEWRKLACYAGVVPFEYSSGTSIRGRKKVHTFADKKMKSLLHMCALSSIRYNAELKAYYDRKKSEGKHSMLVLNNIKCKLLARIFAVINRKQPFINVFKFAS